MPRRAQRTKIQDISPEDRKSEIPKESNFDYDMNAKQ